MTQLPDRAFRPRRGARILLTLFGTPLRRGMLALLVGVIGGRSFAEFTHRKIVTFPNQPVLEYDPGTALISRYLGQPSEDDYLEADPALAKAQPNLDRFYRNTAARTAKLVDKDWTNYSVCIRGMGASSGARGWPFDSYGASYSVDVYEREHVDNRKPKSLRFRVDEYGLPPERPWGWIGNAAFGGGAVGGLVFGLLTWVAIRVQRSLRPSTGFPVILPDGPSQTDDVPGANG